ncbi:MAG: dihydrolipoamide acetyltransferase family protein, partial [Ignavibacteriaceae bacterium]
FDELEKIEGSGIEGRVTKKDILSYIENRGHAKIKSGKEEKKEFSAESEKSFEDIASNLEPGYSSNEVQKVEMDNIRQKIMQHMIRSRDTSVHVSAMLEVDMTRIYNFLKKHKEEYIKKEDVKLTYMAFIANAAVKALREFPLVNSSIEGSTIVKKKFINLGIAVAVEPTGLIVPNIKGAGEKNIIGLAKAINDVANRARNKKLSPDEISNGTFTITNYGVFGTIFGTPIINQPEVAILGVGVVEKKPVVIEVDGADTIAIRPVMAITLSHDHRLVDGMMGGRFLKYIKDVLENFNGNVV